jgi:hypothetical protein
MNKQIIYVHPICLFIFLFVRRSRIIIVGIATMLGTGRPEVRIPLVNRDFSLLQTVKTGSGAHLVSNLVGVKRPECKINHSPS